MQTNVNHHLKRPLQDFAIVATEVNGDEQRLLCLPQIAGSRCVMLEHTVYDMMRRITGDYDGGYWSYFKLSNGGFYMAPVTRQTFDLSCENMLERREVSADTAGVIACAMAYSHLSFLAHGECFASAYHLLSEYIFQHRDAAMIRAALD